MASVLWRKVPNSIHLVRRYIDIISSLWEINGNSAKSVTAVNSKNSPDISIDITATGVKSFLFFKNGIMKKRYSKPP